MRILMLVVCALIIGAALFLGWLLCTPLGARFTVRQIAQDTLGSQRISWDSIDGSLARGIVVQNLQVQDIPRLPPGNMLRVQALSVRLHALALSGLAVDIDNGRLFPHGDEAVVMNVKVRGNSFTANIYTHALDLADVRDILTKFFDVPPMKGTLRNIDLVAGGFFNRPWVAGQFTAERIVRNGFVLEECPVRIDLRFARGAVRWETYGRLDMLGGHLQSPAVRIDLLESRLNFSGRLAWPELDINATSRVARTKIDVRVTGTRDNPKVELESDAPYPKEQLLLMLATGRRWSGMDSALAGNRMTPQLTSNFVEYLLFGGSRGKVVERFGLSDISLIADEKAQGVSLLKDVNDKLGVGYGVRVGPRSSAEARTRDVTQTLESDYHLTERLTISAQKELKTGTMSSGQTAPTTEEEDDRLLFRYRSRF